ncbi:MAG: hypothetical protein AAF934_07130 [Bacteroidota bacterium]
MSFKAGEPVPEMLRNALDEVLEKRDYSIISIKEGMASESTIRALLRGSKVTAHSMGTVHEMVRHGIARCNELSELYTKLKTIINGYKDKTAVS